jgi:hypothetical protein
MRFFSALFRGCVFPFYFLYCLSKSRSLVNYSFGTVQKLRNGLRGIHRSPLHHYYKWGIYWWTLRNGFFLVRKKKKKKDEKMAKRRGDWAAKASWLRQGEVWRREQGTPTRQRASEPASDNASEQRAIASEQASDSVRSEQKNKTLSCQDMLTTSFIVCLIQLFVLLKLHLFWFTWRNNML